MFDPPVLFITNILPYFAATVFAVGMAYRIRGWLSIPVPLKLTLPPAPRTQLARAGRISSELLFFVSLLRSDRGLWGGAWSLHIIGLITLVGHMLGIINIYLSLALIDTAIFFIALLGLVIIAPILYLLLRRVLAPNVSRITVPGDYLGLGLILLHVAIGDYMTFFTKVDLARVGDFMVGLFTVNPVPPPDNAAFVLHFFTFQLLIMYLPFSKLIHPLGMLFSRAMTVQVMTISSSHVSAVCPAVNATGVPVIRSRRPHASASFAAAFVRCAFWFLIKWDSSRTSARGTSATSLANSRPSRS